MDKEKLIKLANIAGYTVEDTTVFGLERTYALFKDGSFDSNFRAWQPHKDIAQVNRLRRKELPK